MLSRSLSSSFRGVLLLLDILCPVTVHVRVGGKEREIESIVLCSARGAWKDAFLEVALSTLRALRLFFVGGADGKLCKVLQARES